MLIAIPKKNVFSRLLCNAIEVVLSTMAVPQSNSAGGEDNDLRRSAKHISNNIELSDGGRRQVAEH
jgi:hypothetical protein